MSISFPGAEGILRRQILERLHEAGRGGMEKSELQRKVDATPEELDRALATLARDGRAVEMEERWYAPEKTGWSVGVVQRLEEGDALVRPGPREDPTFFVRKRNLKRAIDGDRVVVRRLGKARPWDDRPDEGIVVQVLGQGLDTLVGTLETDDRGIHWLTPFDPKLSLELPVEGAEEVPDGVYVVVAVGRGGRAPQGGGGEGVGGIRGGGGGGVGGVGPFGLSGGLPPPGLGGGGGLPPP